MGAVQQFLESMAGSWWVLPCVVGVAAIDGFFPPIPSETTVIAVASVYASAGLGARLPLLVAAAALGAMLGDSAAYWIGRVLKPDRWRMLSRGKGLSAYQWASRTLVKRGGPLILAARYIPVGRVAVNVVAGTLRYPYRQFLMFDVIAGFTWGAYATVIGFVAGAAVGENPLIGVGVGMALAVVIGWAVQRVLGRRLGFDSPPPPDDSMADDAGADGGPVP